mgnify:CR=1 FL=1
MESRIPRVHPKHRQSPPQFRNRLSDQSNDRYHRDSEECKKVPLHRVTCEPAPEYSVKVTKATHITKLIQINFSKDRLSANLKFMTPGSHAPGE